MEENNRKGPGIFYAVVGVATLVVAIVGATFAFFAASAGQDTTTITGTTGQGAALDLLVSRVSPSADPGPLVPLDVEPTGGDTSQLSDALSHACVDSRSNTVCHIYSIRIKNTSTAQVNVAGTIKITSEAPNLKWKFLTDATTDNTDNTFRSPSATAVDITTSETLAPTNGEKTYYVMIWLEETKADQGTGETNDANKSFSGQVVFNAIDASGNATSGLTATFTAAQPEENPEG